MTGEIIRNDPASPIAGEIDNLAIYCTPQKQTADSGPWFIAALAVDSLRKGKAGDFIPKNWTTYTARYVPVGDLGLFTPEYLKETGVTHIVLLESTLNEQDPFYFGGYAIKHNAVMMLWNGEFRYIHCRECALMVLQWITSLQELWGATCSRLN